MKTLCITSPDNTQIAYDRTGNGPAIVLVHGGGGSRHEWHEAGYTTRLRDDFTVITLDLRGHGQSGKPIDPSDYTTEKLGQDILAVADTCEIDHFTLWGMSYGGKVSRYLAVASARVTRFVMLGTPMGLGVSGQRRQEAVDFRAHWTPIVQAQREGTLDQAALSQNDLAIMENFHIPSMLAWVTAMLDWPAVEPGDFRCPTLWLIGSKDQHAVDSFKVYETALKDSMIHVHIAGGLDHNQAFDEIDMIFPTLLAFTKAQVLQKKRI